MRWKNNKNKAKANMDTERETDNSAKKPSVSLCFVLLLTQFLNLPRLVVLRENR